MVPLSTPSASVSLVIRGQPQRETEKGKAQVAGNDWSGTRIQVDDKAKEWWMVKCVKDCGEFIVNGELHDEILEFLNAVSDGLAVNRISACTPRPLYRA